MLCIKLPVVPIVQMTFLLYYVVKTSTGGKNFASLDCGRRQEDSILSY